MNGRRSFTYTIPSKTSIFNEKKSKCFKSVYLSVCYVCAWEFLHNLGRGESSSPGGLRTLRVAICSRTALKIRILLFRLSFLLELRPSAGRIQSCHAKVSCCFHMDHVLWNRNALNTIVSSFLAFYDTIEPGYILHDVH